MPQTYQPERAKENRPARLHGAIERLSRQEG